MPVTRRLLLSLVPAAALPAVARADVDMTRAERSIGKPDAKTTVNEYFSLTCTHCAAFAQGTMPEVKTKLIDTGIVRWVYHDYPLDQVALTASMVARYLPVDRYDPFIDALFATQDRWAFARGANPNDELWKTAALAGMSRQTFDKAVSDTGLRNWILKQQQADQDKWKIDSTPSFVIDNQKYAGEMSYEVFRKLIPT
ncbi:thioredoxin domain-containing protein [Rhodopila sp.]|uniref:thioredoxin domain-containing protein n=1 Tax=Rhodopila sp. TaxID=2480087 RepID=UPI003D13D4A4